MATFSKKEHYNDLRRRRIKFVVEKGAMARMFRKGISRDLQEQLFRRVLPKKLARFQTRQTYDRWLIRTIEQDIWQAYSRNGLDVDRWGLFAKLLNIIVYEVLSNHELFGTADWHRIKHFLHVPLDSRVFDYMKGLDPGFPTLPKLKGMTKETYRNIQAAFLPLARRHGVAPIWFEEAWAAQ